MACNGISRDVPKVADWLTLEREFCRRHNAGQRRNEHDYPDHRSHPGGFRDPKEEEGDRYAKYRG